MSNVTRHALRVYAALGELKGKDNDVLDALIPFFDPVLTVFNGRIFDPHLFALGIRKIYKWRFTGDIAETFIPRLERKGILKKRAASGGAAVWVVNFTSASLGEAPSSILSTFTKIIDEFEKFPPRVTDLLSYSRGRDELEDILIRFLVSMDSPGEGAYLPQLGDLEPGGQAGEILSQLEEGGRPLDQNDRYMCARFVRHLMQARPELSGQLARLASIALLTEVVDDFIKPTNFESRTELTVVLDGPIALDLLGCSGRSLKDDIVTIVEALKAIGAKVVVFPPTCAEMQRNLRSMLALPAQQRYGYTQNAMLKREITEDFVVAVSNNPERALEQAGVTVRPLSLEGLPSSHRYFTSEHYEDFFSTITWGNQVQAREHDATCAALVMRLREGRHSGDLFKCKYVMVTRNPTFVRHVRKYCLESRMITQVQEGPVIHQRELAMTAWLRTGLGANEVVPRRHLISTCDRVLQVRPEVRAAVASHLARLTPERLEQFELLMLDAKSVQKLTDETLNNEHVVTAGNAEHLLQVMRDATAEDVRQRYETELESERALSAQRQEEIESKVEGLAAKLAEAGDHAAEEVRRTDVAMGRILESINRDARALEWIVTAFVLAIVLIGAVSAYIGWFQNYRFIKIITTVAGALSVLRLIFGVLEKPMPGLVSLLNLRIRRSIKKQLELGGFDGPRFSEKIEVAKGRAKLKPE
ncbi:hypothetical protein AB9F45_25965 [Rhizobium leguminosarum]|uniref:hypothetical protein n=1 Tax=Rhizobium leguminosarum TaxID=384 RepID=UPI003F99E9BF